MADAEDPPPEQLAVDLRDGGGDKVGSELAQVTQEELAAFDIFLQVNEGEIDLLASFKELTRVEEGPFYKEEDVPVMKAALHDGFMNFDKFKQYLASKGIKTLDQLEEMAEQRYYEKLGYTNLQQPDYLTKALLEVSRCVRSIQVKNRFKIYQVNEGLEIESSSFSFFKLAVGFWDAFSGYKALLDFFLDIYVTKFIYDANQDK